MLKYNDSMDHYDEDMQSSPSQADTRLCTPETMRKSNSFESSFRAI